MLLGIIAGLVGALVVMTFCAASGALLFSTQLVYLMPMAVASALLGSAIVNVYAPLRSRFTPLAFAPMLSVLAIVADMLTQMLNSPQLQSAQVLPTVVTLLALVTLTSGLCLYGVAVYRLGNVIRFIPYPVLGGILVSMGWLVLMGAIKMITSGQSIQGLSGWDSLPLFSAFLYGLLTLMASRKIRHFLTFPLILIGVIGLTHLSLNLLHISYAQSVTQGWLFPEFPSQTFYSQINSQFFSLINWPVIFSLSAYLITAVLMFLVTSLLSIAAIEIDFNQEGDLNAELKNQAWPNMLSGLLLGLNSAVSVSTSFLIKGMRYSGRLASMVIALVCLLVLLTQVSPLGLIPKFVVSGLLFYVALGIFLDWLVLSWFRMPHLDYALIWLILGTTIVRGLMSGLFVGIVAAGVIFIFVYRQLDSIRFSLRGDKVRSNVMRSALQQAILKNRMTELYVYKLQGYIFFGSANNLLDQIREVFQEKEPRVRFVILDFSLVTGLDSSSCLSFARLLYTAAEQQAMILYTGVSPKNDKLFYLSEIKNNPNVVFLPDLEHGIEWVENQLLSECQAEMGLEKDFLMGQFADPSDYETFLQYFTRLTVQTGRTLCHQGEPSEELFYIESGTVAVIFTDPFGHQKRLRTITSGSFLGEMGFYLNEVRSAALIIEQDAIIYRLSRESYQLLQTAHPDLALKFQEMLIKILGERLQHANLALF